MIVVARKKQVIMVAMPCHLTKMKMAIHPGNLTFCVVVPQCFILFFPSSGTVRKSTRKQKNPTYDQGSKYVRESSPRYLIRKLTHFHSIRVQYIRFYFHPIKV